LLSFSSSSPAKVSGTINGYTIVFAALPVPFGRSVDRELRDVSTRRGTGSEFARQLAALRDRHAKKRTFLDRLSAGGLR
jgi:hypothetical protein